MRSKKKKKKKKKMMMMMMSSQKIFKRRRRASFYMDLADEELLVIAWFCLIRTMSLSTTRPRFHDGAPLLQLFLHQKSTKK